MKNTIVTLAKKISTKFLRLLLTTLATAIGEMIIGGVCKSFTKVKEHRKPEPIVDTNAEAEAENEVVETEEVDVENEKEPEEMKNEEN